MSLPKKMAEQSVGKRSVLDQSVISYFYGAKRVKTNSSNQQLFLKENPSRADKLTETPELKYGVPSIVNPYALVAFPSRYGGDFNTIVDDPSSPHKFSSSRSSGAVLKSNDGTSNIEPTVYNLVNTPPDGSFDTVSSKTPYRYTDFLYCKYYGKIPNNYLITLRRYPAPTYDNLAIPLSQEEASKKNTEQTNFKPIAQAVTWIGEETENKLSELLGFEVTMNWKLFESQVETVPGNEQDAEEGPSIFQGAAKFLSILTGNVGNPFDQRNSQYDPYANGPYSHRVYGPVNTIAKTYKRDRGLDFKQTFTLNFHYSLKSIGSINPKAAMLDIMSNMMQLTYNNAAFWGGANRYFANKTIFPFLGGKAGMNSWYRGDPVGFSKAVGSQLSAALPEISKFFADMLADPINELKKIATGAGSLGMKMLGKGRAPDIVAMKALLTGEPIGEWHMVVGNPYSPILRVGNLICTSAKFQFNDTLGADNFPTELKVTIALEHGRPRDKGDIESMFNDGEGRIYYAPDGMADLFESSAMEDSKNDNSFGNVTDKQAKIKAAQQSKKKSPQKTKASPASAPKSGGVNNTAASTQQTRNAVNTGDTKFDQILDNVIKPFFQEGHDLALKMGLLSAGPRQNKATNTDKASGAGKK